jgi:hypothetical protein
VNERRFVNQYQPQTLVSATMLCYIDAIFGLLYGIANEKKWGYQVAVAAAVLQAGMLVIIGGSDVLSFPLILSFMFDIALVFLLVHPQSRDYQKIWFN